AIRIYRTEYYGQPIFTDELTGCGSPFDPVVLVSRDGFKGLVTLEKNDFALNANAKTLDKFSPTFSLPP
ncbi:MAG: hypothetical protein ACFNOM_00885, partial [Parascardovia denticolens]